MNMSSDILLMCRFANQAQQAGAGAATADGAAAAAAAAGQGAAAAAAAAAVQVKFIRDVTNSFRTYLPRRTWS
eukprot:jgi/Botrbrau1/19771/Bobra.0124s0023.1